jgi:hypothetical protein
MPFFDAIWKTLNNKSWELHRKLSSDAGKPHTIVVLLYHTINGTGISSFVPKRFKLVNQQKIHAAMMTIN